MTGGGAVRNCPGTDRGLRPLSLGSCVHLATLCSNTVTVSCGSVTIVTNVIQMPGYPGLVSASAGATTVFWEYSVT